MKRKVGGLLLIVVLLFSATGAVSVNSATANPSVVLSYITIKSDGSVVPETEFIKQDGNVYTLTSDLVNSYAIKIQRSNIVFDGAGHQVKGAKRNLVISNAGLSIENVTNVTVKNVQLIGFSAEGIKLENCLNCTILRVTAQPFMLWNSNFNTIVESSIVHEYLPLLLRGSNSNTITRNNLTVVDIGGKSNVLFENNIGHITLYDVSTFWDNGSIGNYWSDYATRYPNASEIGNTGIGDTPYVIDADIVDNFPLIAPFEMQPAPTPSPEPQPEPESFPTVLVAVISCVLIILVAVCSLYYPKIRNHLKRSQNKST